MYSDVVGSVGRVEGDILLRKEEENIGVRKTHERVSGRSNASRGFDHRVWHLHDGWGSSPNTV